MRKDGRKQFKCYGSTTATFVDNYDGDTFRVDIAKFHPLIGRGIPIRIAKIQAPERFKGTDDEKKLAEASRAGLNLILGKAVFIRLINMKRGKYFRIVADVVADGCDVGKWLIDNGLAVPIVANSESVKDQVKS